MSGQTHGCRYAAEINAEAWRHSAAGIIELAADARLDGIAHWNAARTAVNGGARYERHMREARAAFARAYELENGAD